MRVLFALCCIVLAAPTLAQVVVIDGGTLHVDGTIYRLWGIEAPEYRQSCADGAPAGIVAREVLLSLVRGKHVECEPRTTDPYGRIAAVCRADGLDLSSMMIRTGWAWMFDRDSGAYVRQESEAWLARAGLHAGDCEPAWDWRP